MNLATLTDTEARLWDKLHRDTFEKWVNNNPQRNEIFFVEILNKIVSLARAKSLLKSVDVLFEMAIEVNNKANITYFDTKKTNYFKELLNDKLNSKLS